MSVKKTKIKSAGKEKLFLRPPVVVVIGHVDHGKTTLLDYIKKTKVAGKEAGGITQKTSAYEVEMEKSETGEKARITFLDTPGHEAFSGMRLRGVNVADIAILVVAADDGVQPQTIEAAKFAQSAGIPILVAFNKTDKPGADVLKTKKQLSEIGVQTEDWGGQVIGVEISAQTGKGVQELLDAVLLLAEMEEIKADPEKPASGIVLESKVDAKKGITATLLIKDGTLEMRDIVAAGKAIGKIKQMEDFTGKAIHSALPGTPVFVMGMNSMPEPGQIFNVYKTVGEAEAAMEKDANEDKERILLTDVSDGDGITKNLRIILKADSQGTLEALETVIGSIAIDGINLSIASKGVGDINENDIKNAAVISAVILGFNSEASSALSFFAEQKKVKIISEKIVYKLVEAIKDLAVSLLPPKIIRTEIGKGIVVAVFKLKKSAGDNFEAVFGARVIDGKIGKGCHVEIFHNGVSQGKGKVVELQFNKNAVDEVLKPNNAGIHYKGNAKMELNDTIEAYTEEIIKQKIN